MRPIWYRSTAISGAVFINEVGKTERLNVEAVLFTFGKGEKDKERARKLEEVAERTAREVLSERDVQILRIWTDADETLSPIDPSGAKGLGGYRVGIRIEDKDVHKADVRFGFDILGIVAQVLVKIATRYLGRY